MATVSLSPAPLNLLGMSSRRVPLGEVPNATNSPFRAVAAAAAKRSREHLEAQELFSYNAQPRAKRQALGHVDSVQKSPLKTQAPQSAEGRIFDGRPTTSQPTAFQKKLLAARETKVQQRVEKHEKLAAAQVDEIRQWQKHYKKLFPSFVFYFESVPEEIRANCSKNVKSLGAVSQIHILYESTPLIYVLVIERREVFLERSHSCGHNEATARRKQYERRTRDNHIFVNINELSTFIPPSDCQSVLP